MQVQGTCRRNTEPQRRPSGPPIWKSAMPRHPFFGIVRHQVAVRSPPCLSTPDVALRPDCHGLAPALRTTWSQARPYALGEHARSDAEPRKRHLRDAPGASFFVWCFRHAKRAPTKHQEGSCTRLPANFGASAIRHRLAAGNYGPNHLCFTETFSAGCRSRSREIRGRCAVSRGGSTWRRRAWRCGSRSTSRAEKTYDARRAS